MTVAFDTLKFAQALRDKAHVPQEQAEGMAEAFAAATGEQIATKGDLNELALRLETKMSGLEAKISEAKADMVKWMFGQALVIIGVIATLLRFSH